MADKEQVYGVKPQIKVVETNKTERYGEYFTLVTSKKQTRIVCGNAIVSREVFKSVKEAKAYIDKKPWELIVNTACWVFDMTHQNNQPSK